MIWWCRTIPPDKIKPTMIKYDNIIKNSISLMIGRSISKDKWSILINSIKRGGLGLRTSSQLLSAFYLPSVHNSIDIAQDLVHPKVFKLYQPELNRRIQFAISEYN
eukprot:302039_1